MKSVQELAADFDRSFAEPVAARGHGVQALAIRAGDAPYVLPLSAVGLVLRAPKIVHLPNGPATQLGVAGVRGTLMTIISLAMLLGARPGADAHGWIATPKARRGLALAFDALDGQIIIEPGALPANVLDLEALLTRSGIGA